MTTGQGSCLLACAPLAHAPRAPHLMLVGHRSISVPEEDAFGAEVLQDEAYPRQYGLRRPVNDSITGFALKPRSGSNLEF